MRNSYARPLGLPAGGCGRDEDPRLAAVRELREEVGLDVAPEELRPAGLFVNADDYKEDRAHVFEWDAPVKLPTSPGPYRLEGIDAAGGRMFSLSFTPDEVDHGGAGFLFAVPAEEGWADEMQRVTLTGPEGAATLDRDADGDAGAIVTSRSTGRILSIVRDWSRVRPEAFGSAAEVSVSRSVLVREVRERQR